MCHVYEALDLGFKIFKPALKDYLLLHSYFAWGTFSTDIVQIIKYLLTLIPCCGFGLYCVIFYRSTYSVFHIVLYYTALYSCYDKFILVLKRIYGMEINSIVFYCILIYKSYANKTAALEGWRRINFNHKIRIWLCKYKIECTLVVNCSTLASYFLWSEHNEAESWSSQHSTGQDFSHLFYKYNSMVVITMVMRVAAWAVSPCSQTLLHI